MSIPTIEEWPKVARKLEDWQLDLNIESYWSMFASPYASKAEANEAGEIHYILLTEKRRRGKLGTKRQWRIMPMFAWYDLWIGVYVDRPRRRAYVLPLPCLGFRVEW